MTPEKVVEVQKYGREPISLHTPLGEDGDSEFGDLIEDSEAVVPADAVSFTLLQEQLHSVLDTLSEREAGVVSMRFGLTDGQPKTLDEIGKVYGVTRERIRQIESKTMSKLRHPSRSQALRECCAPFARRTALLVQMSTARFNQPCPRGTLGGTGTGTVRSRARCRLGETPGLSRWGAGCVLPRAGLRKEKVERPEAHPRTLDVGCSVSVDPLALKAHGERTAPRPAHEIGGGQYVAEGALRRCWVAEVRRALVVGARSRRSSGWPGSSPACSWSSFSSPTMGAVVPATTSSKKAWR